MQTAVQTGTAKDVAIPSHNSVSGLETITKPLPESLCRSYLGQSDPIHFPKFTLDQLYFVAARALECRAATMRRLTILFHYRN